MLKPQLISIAIIASTVLSYDSFMLILKKDNADKQKKTQHLSRNGLQLMRLKNKKRHQHIRQVLVAPGSIEANVGGKIPGIDNKGKPDKGGETCPKP